MADTNINTHFRLLDLPAEVRQNVYIALLEISNSREFTKFDAENKPPRRRVLSFTPAEDGVYSQHDVIALLAVNRQIRTEFLPVVHDLFTFKYYIQPAQDVSFNDRFGPYGVSSLLARERRRFSLRQNCAISVRHGLTQFRNIELEFEGMGLSYQDIRCRLWDGSGITKVDVDLFLKELGEAVLLVAEGTKAATKQRTSEGGEAPQRSLTIDLGDHLERHMLEEVTDVAHMGEVFAETLRSARALATPEQLQITIITTEYIGWQPLVQWQNFLRLARRHAGDSSVTLNVELTQ